MSENKNFINFEKIKVLNELKNNIMTNIKLLFIFRYNIILVTNEDKAYCYGANTEGVLGFGHQDKLKKFTINKYLSYKKIIDFKNSSHHTIARTRDGKLYSWGCNSLGFLGNGKKDDEIHKPELNSTLMNENADICCGKFHTIVLTSNEELYAWGGNRYGQIGNMSNENVLIPCKIEGFNNEKVKAISCGSIHSIAMTERGRIYSWGGNKWGQLGLNDGEESLNKPKHIKIEDKGRKTGCEIEVEIKRISCGKHHSLLLSSEGDIYVFGSNKYHQLGLMTNEEKQLTPIKLNHSEKFIEIASHPYHNISAALLMNGSYYVWGKCGGEGIISEPKETKFKSFEEIFVDYLQISCKTINKIEECLKNLFSSENQKYEKNFHVVDLIDKGSFGMVFKVLDLNCKKKFAIKIIPISDGFENKIVKLSKESKILAKMNSYYVVKCFDFWTEKNYYHNSDSSLDRKAMEERFGKNHELFKPYNNLFLHIQMEFCYKTLDKIMQIVNQELNSKVNKENNTLKYFISSQIFKELVECLNYLHTQNPPIIHRDLKPANILISYGSDGRFVKFADFGYAVFHEYDNQSHTQDKGTISYIAPEVEYTKHYDTKSDVYSLGKITGELFHIFDANSNDLEDRLLDRKDIVELFVSMTAHIPNSRPTCTDILNKSKLWEMNPNQLIYQTKIELKKDRNSIEDSFHLYFIRKKIMNFQRTTHDIKSNFEINKRYDLKFDDLEVIAFGNYSVVYKAIGKSNNRIYAIKKIPIFEDFKEKALQEIKVLHELKSDRIVKLKSFWFEKNYYHSSKTLMENLGSDHELFKKNNTQLLHIQMEFCYKTLNEIIEIVNKELNQKESEVMSPLGYYISSELFIEVLESVEYLHEQNIIHRDLKPSNILITDGSGGRFVKVADFGLATFHDFEGQSHTKGSGSPVYRAPEVSQTKRYDKKADIYSLGIIAPKLFNIDINEPIGEKSCLETEYSNLFDLIEKMSSIVMKKRPNCNDILRRRSSWALSLHELKKSTDLKNIIETDSKPIKESFHNFFIRVKS